MNKIREPQDRGSNIRLPKGVTPEQAIAGIFKIKPADVKRIKETEKKLSGKGKKRSKPTK